MFRFNVFRHELTRLRRPTARWALGVVAIHWIYLPFYPSLAQQAQVWERSLQSFPQAFLQAFGLDRIHMGTVPGFYALIFPFIQLLLAIQATGYGVGLLTREEQEGTADFLLTKPISRWAVLNGKLAAALVSLLATQAVLWASAWLGWRLFHGDQPYNFAALRPMLGSALPFQLFFLSLGLVCSLLVRRVRQVTPYALGIGLGFYALGAFGDASTATPSLEWLTPFKHFDPPTLVTQGALDPRWVSVDLALALVGLAFAYWRYLHRDIPASV